MREIIIFEKYKLTENGEVININSGKSLKIEEKVNGRFVKLTINKKTRRVNIDILIDENFPPIVEEKKIVKNRKSKHIIRVTELDGTVREFKTFKEGNDFYGLRKDYLNYCIAEKFKHMLTKGDLKLKSVEKISV